VPAGKVNKTAMIVVIVLISAALFGVIFGRFKIESSLRHSTNEIEHFVMDNHSNLDFVRNGLDMTVIQNDISRLNSIFADLNTILRPQANELGIPRLIYNTAFDYVTREIQRRLAVVNTAGNAANIFADENNMLTISSILNGFQRGIMNIVNIVALIIVLILVLILGIYIFKSLTKAAEERKSQA